MEYLQMTPGLKAGWINGVSPGTVQFNGKPGLRVSFRRGEPLS
jgi:hypothetical protein